MNFFESFFFRGGKEKVFSVTVIVQLKDVISIVSQDNNVNITQYDDNIIETSENLVDQFINTNEEEADEEETPNEDLIDIASFSVNIYLKKKENKKAKKMLKKIHKIYKKNLKLSKNIDYESSITTTDQFGYFTFHRWSNGPKSLSAWRRRSIENYFPMIDFTKSLSFLFPTAPVTTKYIYVTTTVNVNVTKEIGTINSLDNEDDDEEEGDSRLRFLQEESTDGASGTAPSGVAIYTVGDDGNLNEVTIPTNAEMLVEFPPTAAGLENKTITNYIFYKQRGIDIFDPNDEAFVEDCYYNEDLEYDLPQLYRRKKLYQEKTFGSDTCTYQEFNLETGYIVMKCQYGKPMECKTIEKPLNLTQDEIDHEDNLPTKCGGSIASVDGNIAFWLYLVLFVVFIITNIILFAITKCFGISSSSLMDVIRNDGLYSTYSNEVPVSDKDKISRREDIKTDTNLQDVNIQIESPKSFGAVLINNFKELHPLCNLCRSSIISPIIFTHWIFLYNILNLFGFNALYFTNDMLEDRIFDAKRDNFGYPMKTEFEKIMSAIATSIALTIVVRAITIVTYQQKEELSNKVSNIHSHQDRANALYEFSQQFTVRRIIAGIFMLALNIFFWYYTIVFCGIYVNTQYGWFYSGLWALFMNWVCFAPFYIVIISAIESSDKMDKCAYYMKRLFIF